MFSYYDKDLFGMYMLREVDDPRTLPKFHSRSLFPKETFFFDEGVNDMLLKMPKFVKFINPIIITIPFLTLLILFNNFLIHLKYNFMLILT